MNQVGQQGGTTDQEQGLQGRSASKQALAGADDDQQPVVLAHLVSGCQQGGSQYQQGRQHQHQSHKESGAAGLGNDVLQGGKDGVHVQ